MRSSKWLTHLLSTDSLTIGYVSVKNEKILLSKDKNLLHYFYLHESKYYALDENGWKILNLQ